MIQAIISRLAQNSFLLKGWSVTIASAMVALALSDKTKPYAGLALFPAVVFWGLDAYYLRQERLFRELHRSISLSGSGMAAYSLDTDPHKGQVRSWFRTLWSPTVALLHGTAVVVVLIVLGLSVCVR
jgi:hypothetical protein